MKEKKKNSTYHWSDEHTHTPAITNDLKKILSKEKFKKYNHLDVGCGNGYITKKKSTPTKPEGKKPGEI